MLPMPPRSAFDSSARADTASADLGRLLLRVAIGGLVLLHGWSKVRSGPADVIDLLRAHDLPGLFGWLVYIGEVLAPLMLIAGWWTRAAALVVALHMVAALGLAHQADLGRLGPGGGWAVELQMLYLAGALAIALLGAGRLAAGGQDGRFN